ncbi:hypothetical protein [Streptomyces phaeoluteigriseus]
MEGHEEDRTLEALGLADAPRDHPLLYPGVWPAESGLLDGDRLLPLDRLTFPERTPVLAVGSNACPGQLRHKMAEFGLSSPIPMVRTRVTGIDVGVSAHVSVLGYVPASPVHTPGVTRELFVIWLDGEQLGVVDATEPNFDRVPLPDPSVRIGLDDGGTLSGVFAYVSRHGVLHDGDGVPRSHPGQHSLITELLRGSTGLRRMFGVTPEEFCVRARTDARLCERAARMFAEEEMVTRSGLEHLRTTR